ncbi:MAG: Bug family tripartite tricarboxylate transporter substrate binding protein [Burkholderiales bacterium]
MQRYFNTQLSLTANLLLAVIAAFAAFTAPPTIAQDYPSKPIRVIVPNPPGGANDVLARILSEKLRDLLGQQVLVENRAGAAGNVGAEVVWRAPGDGYTFLLTTPAPLVSNKSLYAKLNFDPDTFVPVSVIVQSPNVLAVRPGVPANNVNELLTYARANPDKLNYATQGAGTGAHLTSELLKMTADVKIVHVPYKGTAPALTDMFGGQVDMMFVAFGDVFQHIRAGKLRALAVGSTQRNPRLPEVPTMSDTLPGFVSVFWQGMVASPATPAPIAARISAAVAESLKQADVAKRLQDMSTEPVGSTPSEMATFMRQEIERWSKVIRATGAKAE